MLEIVELKNKTMNNERIIELQVGETVIIKHVAPIDEWLTISKFAKFKNIARSTLYARIKNGEIEVNKDIPNKPKININQLNK